MGRLPWIQLGAAFELAPRLEGLLGVSYLEALGLLAQLDRVAVELVDASGAPTGLFPGERGGRQLASSVRWPAAKAEELILALVEVGKVEVEGEGAGVRVLGLEWAVKALTAQAGARKRAIESLSRKLRASCAQTAGKLRESAALDQDLDQDLETTTTTAGVPPAGPSDSAGNGFQRQKEGLLFPEPLIAPGAALAAKASRRKAKAPEAPEEPNAAPRRQLSDALVADFEDLRRAKYAFAGARDGKALDVLIDFAAGEIDEVRRRWRWGLNSAHERDGGPPWAGRVNTIAELALPARWNALAAAPATPRGVSSYRTAFEGGEVPNEF